MIEYIRNNQLDIMLFFSGACAVLIPLTWVTTTLSCKRKWMLTLIELSSALLLIFDRFAYIYRGDPSNLGYWMVRISNFFVFSMQVFELEALNIYLSDADILSQDGIPVREKTLNSFRMHLVI